MAEQKEDLDRSEPATAYKLEKARRRGSVVRSTEVTFAIVLLVCVACVYGLGANLVDEVALLFRQGLSFAGRRELSSVSALAYVQALGVRAVIALAPAVLAVWLGALLVAGLQARGVFTAEPLKPDFTRLNPATGFKRVLSMKALHDLWRSTAKLTVLSTAVAVWGYHHFDDLLGLSVQSPRAMTASGLQLLGSCLTLLAGLVLVFALLDWGVNRWDFMRKMRMSKREVRDEHKEREGDPRIKARLRELRLQWLKRSRQLTRVRSADVLVTNPAHYAVAIEYRSADMPAPMITARGAGEMATRMRAEARRHNVPVCQNPPLARALYALNDAEVLVPEQHFVQVARVLRWVYAGRAGHGAGRALA